MDLDFGVQSLDLETGPFSEKKCNIIVWEWGGEGGQRPFETFPKIHPFWKGDASLKVSIIKYNSSPVCVLSIWLYKSRPWPCLCGHKQNLVPQLSWKVWINLINSIHLVNLINPIISVYLVNFLNPINSINPVNSIVPVNTIILVNLINSINTVISINLEKFE